MKKLFYFLTAVLVCITAQAQVTNFSLFKVTVYHQDSPAAPTNPDVPNAYYFAAQLNFVQGATNGVQDVTITGPVLPTSDFVENTPIFYTYNGAYFDLKTDFDAVYPAGEYDFEVDYTNSLSDFGAVTIPDHDIYPTNIPAFNPDNWIAMQYVDPAQDFTLNWNGFVPDTNTTAAYTFINFTDSLSGNGVYSIGYLDPSTTTTNIPANTFAYGTTYEVDMYFSDRQDTQDAGFGHALGTVGFDRLTHTTLKTISPWLQIAPAGANVVLMWPAAATNYVLQSVDQLPGPSIWPPVFGVPTTVGGTNYLTLPATQTSQFFRLYQTSHLVTL